MTQDRLGDPSARRRYMVTPRDPSNTKQDTTRDGKGRNHLLTLSSCSTPLHPGTPTLRDTDTTGHRRYGTPTPRHTPALFDSDSNSDSATNPTFTPPSPVFDQTVCTSATSCGEGTG
jgi:hypothetical protein